MLKQDEISARLTKKHFLWALAIALLAFSIYSNSLSNGFVYDDAWVVSQNNFIKNLKFFPSIFRSEYFSLSGELSYRPLVTMSYFLDYLLWAQNPKMFHLTNVVLHALTSASLYVLIVLLFGRAREAALAAAIFAVHPLNSEAVNAVGFREDLLAALFFVLSLALYVKSSASQKMPLLCGGAPSARLKYIIWRINSIFAFALAIFSKETAIVLPALLLTFDLFIKSPESKMRTRGNLISRYYGYAALISFYLLLRFYLLRDPRELALISQNDPFFLRVIAWFVASAHYIFKLLFPVALNADYDFNVFMAARSPAAVFSTLLMAILVATAIFLARRSRAMLFSLIWAFLTLLPASNIIPIANPLAERYLYLPLAGLGIAISFALAGIYMKVKERKFCGRLIWACLFLVISFGAALSFQRNFVWSDELSLWKDTAPKSPQKARVRFALGAAFGAGGNRDKAMAEYAFSLSIEPIFAKAFLNIGQIYHERGLLNIGMAYYKGALAIDGGNSNAMYNLAKLFKDMGLPALALTWYGKTLAKAPLFSDAHYNIGNIYQEALLSDKALAEYYMAIYIRPDHASALNNSGIALQGKGAIEAAAWAYEKSIKSAPLHASSFVNLGNLYARMGKLDLASRYYFKAASIDPDFLAAHNNLGVLMAKQKAIDKAVAEYKIALSLQRDHREVIFNLANLYALKGFSARAEAEYRTISEVADGMGRKAREKLIDIFAKRQSFDKAAFEFISMIESVPEAQKDAQRISVRDFLKVLKSMNDGS